MNSGQICSAGTRLFVQRPIYEEFVQRVAAFAKTLKVGNPLDPATQLGPVVSSEQLERVTGYLELGKQQGARALAGGGRFTAASVSQHAITNAEVISRFLPVATTFAEDDGGKRHVVSVVRSAGS